MVNCCQLFLKFIYASFSFSIVKCLYLPRHFLQIFCFNICFWTWKTFGCFLLITLLHLLLLCINLWSLKKVIRSIGSNSASYLWQLADNNRPDLKKATFARLSAVNRRLKVAKSGVKKRHRRLEGNLPISSFRFLRCPKIQKCSRAIVWASTS